MTKTATPQILDQDSIEVRAYYLWEAEGRPHGRHEAHWLAAEATEKRSSSARRAATTRRAKQDAAPKATAKAVIAAAALSGSRSGRAASRGQPRVH